MGLTWQLDSLFERRIVRRGDFSLQQPFSVLNQPPHIFCLMGKHHNQYWLVDVKGTDPERP
jgi:hypothetical protein